MQNYLYTKGRAGLLSSKTTKSNLSKAAFFQQYSFLFSCLLIIFSCQTLMGKNIDFKKTTDSYFSKLVRNYSKVVLKKTKTYTNGFMAEICDNGVDDDGDGLIDSADPDCINHCEGLRGLGTANNFGILALNGGDIIINSGTTVTSNIGYSNHVISNTNQKVGDDGPFTGTVYVHSNVQNFNYSMDNFLPSGGVIQNNAIWSDSLDQANIDVINAATYFSSLSPDITLGVLTDDDNRTVNATGDLTVVEISSLDYNSDVLELIGTVGQDDAFVINVLGYFGFNQSEIRLTNVRPERVVFNFPNASTLSLNKSANIFQGTILAPTSTVEYHNPAVFNGGIYAPNINLHSDFNFTHHPLEIIVPWRCPEICNNNIDDDGDNLIDSEDPECPNCATALLNNPTFDNDFTGWTEWNNTSIFEESPSGNKVGRVSGGQGGFGQDYATSGGEPFTLNFYAKKDNSELASGGLAFYDSNWNKVGADATIAVTSANFKRYSISAVSPANTAWVQVFAWKAAGTGSADYDAFCLINANEICGNNIDDDGDGAIDEADNDCLPGCPLTNIYPGFALGTGAHNCSWLDYALGNDLRIESNSNGTLSILGTINSAIDADWDTCTTNPCGLNDEWAINFILSDKKTWAEWQAEGGTAYLNANCNTQASLDYWDVQGTLTGLGCNAGRTIDILGPASTYRFQIGFGGNSGDGNCNFGLSTWFQAEENGQSVNMDIYAFIDETCYRELTCDDLQIDNIAVSNCIDHPLRDVATVDVTVSWTNPPANDSLEVSIDNQTLYINVANGAVSPQTVQFTIPADGSTNNNLKVNWRNADNCLVNGTYDAPTACSNDEIACAILYICGDDKPYDGDAWDHGWIEYLDAVNGNNPITPAFSKPDANGLGLYDPHNTANALAIDLDDYDLIIVSATTEARLSNDLITALANTSKAVLNSNYLIVNDLGMTATEAGYTFQDNAYIDNATSETIYNFNNKIQPTNGEVVLRGNYAANADALLWTYAGNYNNQEEAILFHYSEEDALPGIPNTHGNRTHLGYHMNGVYSNAINGGALPTPDSLWFDPAKHLTLVGKTYLDSAIVLAAANCGVVNCCSQINYNNNSLEEGNFASFNSNANPNGSATLTTFGGSDAVNWNPSGGFGTNGSPITDFGANQGYWVDASTNGGFGAIDGDRFYWLEPRVSANGSDCIGAVAGADLLGTFCQGSIVEICGYVAAYNPNAINGGGAGTDFKFEIYSNNGQDPADFVTTPSGTIATDDNGDNNESFTLPLPFSNNVLDITGANFTGANGQVADWRTLNWQLVCFQIELKEDQNNYSSIVFSMSDGSGGMAVDNLSIRDVTTPNAGRDTTIQSCIGIIDLVNAQNGESWSKITEPNGANATINATTGAVTDMTENGVYKFLLSKTTDPTCHDTIRVIVSCPTEICGDNLDNDGDGLTDCADPDCQSISLSNLSFSSCVQNGNQYQATLTVEVAWSNAPSGENIVVAANNTTQTIDLINGATSPSSVQFTVNADNSQNNPINISYSGGSGCDFNSTYNAPSPCPEPVDRDKPCTNASGFVGGVVFEDYDGDALQDEGEPGLAGILVTAVDTLGQTVGQTNTNNIGVFEFSSLTDGDKFRLEFSAIPSGMYPTSGSTYKGTTVQFVAAPTCATTLGLIDPTENDCEATNNAILQNGYSLVACLPSGDDVTLAVKDITQLGTLWQTPANRNNNQFGNVPTVHTWETVDFEGAAIFSMTTDPRDGTIYAISTPFYSDEFDGGGTILNEFVPAKVFKINAVTGAVSRIALLGGTLGLGYIDFDLVNEQLLITNIDDGKIYRLNTDGAILGNFDPLTADNGTVGQLPALGERVIGVAFNPIDKRVYYSTWNNHPTFITDYENVNNDFNTIRSIGLDENGDFVTATDRLEISLPHNLSSSNGNYLTNPVADIAFNRIGDRMLLSAISFSENNSTGEISVGAHASVVREYHKSANVWTLEPTYGSNNEGKYDIGSQTYYKGRNSRGGIDWAYRSISGDTIIGNDDYILATGDALHIQSVEGDYIYGYQFTPATGGDVTNSVLVDLDNDLVNADKYIYSDVDIYKDYCANLTLEIGNSVWLDADSDGIQDADEVGLSGVRVSLFNAAGDSLTTVTSNADGEYYFSEYTSGFAGLLPNTDYYLVIGKGGQYNTSNNSLFFVFNLTDENAIRGNYPDLVDSDAILGDVSYGHPASIDGYPVIAVRTGAMGQNNHSFDFGFKEICTPAVAVNDSISLCPGTDYEGSVAVNDSNYDDKSFSVLVQPTDGTVVMNEDGIFKYEGTTSDCGNDEFIYQVCDSTNICCSSATVYLDFNDSEKPTLQNVPADDTVSCDEIIPLPTQIFAVDNCPRISLDVTETSTQGEDGCSLYDYTITRTWTAFDQCGNSTSASQVIDVQDVVAPDIYRIYTLPNGKKMVAGVMEFVGQNWKIVNLPIDFATKPIILHQVVTTNDATPVISQIQNTSVAQFELRIKEEENLDNEHTRESVAWIAMEAGTQLTDYQLEMNSMLLSDAPQVNNFQNNFATPPALFTSSQTTNEEDPFFIRNSGLTIAGMTLNIQEETSADTETSHIEERVGYLALENNNELRDQKGILIGEVGTATLNENWTTVHLNNSYHNPVVIASSLSNVDNEPAIIRVSNVGLDNFQVHIEEWDYLDGNHSNETVSYLVIEGSIPLESPTYCDNGTDSLDVGIDFKAVDNCDVSVVINYTEQDTFIGATKIITRTWAAEDECGNKTAYSQEISCEGVSLQLKSTLQGAMLENSGNGLMRDDLRKKGLLPHQEPYSTMPRFQHVASGGGEIMDTTLLAIDGANGIVDWVFVELRDANDVDNVVATKAALIQCDGDVVTAEGDSILLFTNTRVGDYYIAIRHRNHLGMITLNTETFSPVTVPFVDFTFTFTPVVGTHASVKMDNLESMWGGDLNNDGKVIYQGPNNDIFYMFLNILQSEGNEDFLPNYINSEYTNDDFNLDGTVIYQGPNNDRARLLFSTILSHPENPQKFSNFIIYTGN